MNAQQSTPPNPSGLYTIKPLEWTTQANGRTYNTGGLRSFIIEIVMPSGHYGIWWVEGQDDGYMGTRDSLDAAKLACSAHHREQVARMLEPVAMGPVEVVVTGEEETPEMEAALVLFSNSGHTNPYLLTSVGFDLERRLRATEAALRLANARVEGKGEGR